MPLELSASDPLRYAEVTEWVSEFAVSVALTGIGLKIDCSLSISGWTSTWRLLVESVLGLFGEPSREVSSER